MRCAASSLLMVYFGLFVDELSGEVELLVLKRRGSVAAPLELGLSQLKRSCPAHTPLARMYISYATTSLGITIIIVTV
jgi:hypothetical protein